jgi:hypothetical protein
MLKPKLPPSDRVILESTRKEQRHGRRILLERIRGRVLPHGQKHLVRKMKQRDVATPRAREPAGPHAHQSAPSCSSGIQPMPMPMPARAARRPRRVSIHCPGPWRGRRLSFCCLSKQRTECGGEGILDVGFVTVAASPLLMAN